MAIRRTQEQLGFSEADKQQALNALGYVIMDYTGKIAEAPAQIRHLVRELQPGYYLVNTLERVIIKRLDQNASGHKFVYDKAALLHEAFKEAIFYVLQTDYVYALKNTDNTFDFTGYASENPDTKIAAISELAQSKYSAGFYGLQVNDRSVVLYTTHVYKVFEDLIIDLAIYSPVSPFSRYAKPVVSSKFTGLSLEYSKFQFSGDAVITQTALKNGKLVATIVNYPEIDGIEKLFVKAPDMLRLLLELTTVEPTAGAIVSLKATARNIIGEIGT